MVFSFYYNVVEVFSNSTQFRGAFKPHPPGKASRLRVKRQNGKCLFGIFRKNNSSETYFVRTVFRLKPIFLRKHIFIEPHLVGDEFSRKRIFTIGMIRKLILTEKKYSTGTTLSMNHTWSEFVGDGFVGSVLNLY